MMHVHAARPDCFSFCCDRARRRSINIFVLVLVPGGLVYATRVPSSEKRVEPAHLCELPSPVERSLLRALPLNAAVSRRHRHRHR